MAAKKEIESKRTYIVRHLRIAENTKHTVCVATARTLAGIQRDNAGLFGNIRIGDVVWRIFSKDPEFCAGAVRFRSGAARAQLVWFDMKHKRSVEGPVELGSHFPSGPPDSETLLAVVDEKKGHVFNLVTGEQRRAN